MGFFLWWYMYKQTIQPRNIHYRITFHNNVNLLQKILLLVRCWHYSNRRYMWSHNNSICQSQIKPEIRKKQLIYPLPSWTSYVVSYMSIFIHCREQLRSWHLQSYKIAHVGDGEFRQVPTVTLARRNTVLFYQHTIQACHLSCFCVSWFIGLYTMIIWNIGMWNLRNMIVTYKPDITDVTFVTVEYDYNCRCKYGRNCQRSTINI